MDDHVIGADGRRARAITMIEYIHATPFTQEIEGERVELRDSVLVGKIECHVIHVVYGINGQEATWYFAKKDLLPRRVRRSFPAGREGRAYRDYVISNLEVRPHI